MTPEGLASAEWTMLHEKSLKVELRMLLFLEACTNIRFTLFIVGDEGMENKARAARLELKKKAGFGSLAATGRLQIVESHHLVKDGLYKHIRHPIYLGEILRNFGVVSIFSSVYGVLLMAVATGFLFFRMKNEEKMLIEQFGEEYREYQRMTKKIIPYIY